MDPNEVNISIEHWFTYHSPDADQIERYQRLRNKAKELAYAIDECCLDCPDKSAAMRKLRECVMTANAAIALENPLPISHPAPHPSN